MAVDLGRVREFCGGVRWRNMTWHETREALVMLEALVAEVEGLREEIEGLREKAWRYDELCQ